MSDAETLDGELLELPCGEQFLIWALRLWVRAYKAKGNLHATLHKGFCLAGLEEGYRALDELLTVVSLSATTSIDVRCQHCGGISLDEQIFIGQIAALQRSDFAASRKLMGYWLAPAGVRLAETPAARLAHLMAVVGLTLRPRTIARRADPLYDRAAASEHRPASSTLH